MNSKITLSSRGQGFMNGAKEYLIWMTRYDGTQRVIGTAFKTRHGDWCAQVDDNRGSLTTHLHRQFKHLKESVVNQWA